MRELFARLLKDSLTGLDGKTFDAWRLSALLALLALIVNASYATWQSHSFSAVDFGGGCAALLGGAAWGIRQKQDTEPGAQP
jgi:hypothetical protein